MNREVKAKWLAALRSGEYEQGKSRLARVEDGVTRFCCLGVLCELAVEEEVIEPPVRPAMHGVLVYATSSISVLPNAVIRWAGLGDQENPPIRDPRKRQYVHSLAEANDVGDSFEVIADIIEEQL